MWKSAGLAGAQDKPSKFSSLLTLLPTSGLDLPSLPPAPGKLKSRKLKSLRRKAVPIWPPRLFPCTVTGDCSQTAVHTGHFQHKSLEQHRDLRKANHPVRNRWQANQQTFFQTNSKMQRAQSHSDHQIEEMTSSSKVLTY